MRQIDSVHAMKNNTNDSTKSIDINSIPIQSSCSCIMVTNFE